MGAAALLVLSLLACTRPAQRDPAATLAMDGAAAEAGYLAPPRVLDAIAQHGEVWLVGKASPNARVELSTPEGEHFTATADAGGAWTLSLPQAARPRMYALASRSGDQTVHADGALLTAPHAGAPALLVRAGYAALPIGKARALDIVAVDYDPGGFAAVAGMATPRAPVRLSVDGSPAGVGQSDENGRYALLAANRRLEFGAHRVEVSTPAGVVARDVVLEPPAQLTSPYQVTGAPGQWQVEWALNGGGVQTTLITGPGG